MKPEYLAPYVVSNLFAFAALLISVRSPQVSRWIIAGVFGLAAVANTRMAIIHPEDYLAYGDLATLEIYREFIKGFFARNAQSIVLLIASGQALICLFFILGTHKLLTLGALGAVLFLLGIAPLGVGSAFPFSLSFGAAVLMTWLGLTRTAQRVKSGAVGSPEKASQGSAMRM